MGSSKEVKTKTTGHQNPCLGHNVINKDPRKKISECISITYKDFKKLMGTKSSNDIPGLAADFIKVMTLDMIDLRNFERTMAHYRDQGGYNGTLVKLNVPEKVSSPSLDQLARENYKENLARNCTKKDATPASPMKQINTNVNTILRVEASKVPYVPKHTIFEPFTIKDHYAGGEFAGKILIKVS